MFLEADEVCELHELVKQKLDVSWVKNQLGEQKLKQLIEIEEMHTVLHNLWMIREQCAHSVWFAGYCSLRSWAC